MNAGQSCIAVKRLIVVDKIHDRFVEQFVKRMAATRVTTHCVSTPRWDRSPGRDLRDKLHRQVEGSIANGARLRTLAAAFRQAAGNFYPPTVLTNVKKGMPAFDEGACSGR